VLIFEKRSAVDTVVNEQRIAENYRLKASIVELQTCSKEIAPREITARV